MIREHTEKLSPAGHRGSGRWRSLLRCLSLCARPARDGAQGSDDNPDTRTASLSYYCEPAAATPSRGAKGIRRQ